MTSATAKVPAKEPVTCAHPGCGNTFVPRHKDHRFCSQICKRRSHEYRFALGARK